MGHIHRHNIVEYKQKYNLDIFVETGTYQGGAIQSLLPFNFNKYYSVELVEHYYTSCKHKFKNYKNVFLYNLNSLDGLDYILKELASCNGNGNVLYWLDAHLPNLYVKNYENNYTENSKILIPLEQELNIIKNNRDISNDVFIIDDLRIYERGPFKGGNWTEVIDTNLYNEGALFVDNLLSETHTVTRQYEDQGYLICVPRYVK